MLFLVGGILDRVIELFLESVYIHPRLLFLYINAVCTVKPSSCVVVVVAVVGGEGCGGVGVVASSSSLSPS